MKAIITGINGQDGAYLAHKLCQRGIQVIGIIRSDKSNLNGLDYLQVKNQIEFKKINLENAEDVYHLIKTHQPNFVFNLAAQSSVAESFSSPHSTILFNVHSTLNLLEAIRMHNIGTRFYQATSSEMFGSVSTLPITENTLLNPQSPYAISKSSCHHLVRNYRNAYNLHASSGILFNHESVLRRENFFIMKVIKTALDIKAGKTEYLEVGNIDIKRDFGYAPFYVDAMIKMIEMEQPDDYIICSGKSVSLRSIIYHLFSSMDIEVDRVKINQKYFRPSEIGDIYGDNAKAKSQLNWNYNIEFTEVLDKIVAEYKNNFYHG